MWSRFAFYFVAAGTALLSHAAQASHTYGTEKLVLPGEYRYQLVMNQDPKVCDRILELYNGDLAKHGHEKYEGHAEFSVIAWHDTKAFRMEGSKKRYTFLKSAQFDINNDGKTETVLKEEATLSGYPADTLYIFNAGKVDLSKDIHADTLKDATAKIYLAPWYYRLQSPLDKLWGIRVLQPFVIDGKIYLSMRTLYEAFPNSGEIAVVASYKNGRLVTGSDQTGVMQDICYLKRERTIPSAPAGKSAKTS